MGTGAGSEGLELSIEELIFSVSGACLEELLGLLLDVYLLPNVSSAVGSRPAPLLNLDGNHMVIPVEALKQASGVEEMYTRQTLGWRI